MIEDGAPMEADYNRFDCFHETTPHPHMKDGAWTRAYAEAWRRFYSLENMKAILSRTHPERYWDVFFNLFWYKNSIVNEGMHPMLTGLVRLKDRGSRRACFPQESRLAHLRRRIPEIYKFLRGTLRVALEMEELWLATRKRSETEVRVIEELAAMRAELRCGLRISDLQTAYIRAKARMPSIEVPSRLSSVSRAGFSFAGQPPSSNAARPGQVLDWGAPAVSPGPNRDSAADRSTCAECVAGDPPGGRFPHGADDRGPIGKANPEHRSSEPGLDICPVPPAETGG